MEFSLEKIKTIHDLKLNESIEIISDGFGVKLKWEVMRVPGGWIYLRWNQRLQEYSTGIFVEYNNEFQVESEN